MVVTRTNQQPVQHDECRKENSDSINEFVSHVPTGFPDLVMQSLCRNDSLGQPEPATFSKEFDLNFGSIQTEIRLPHTANLQRR